MTVFLDYMSTTPLCDKAARAMGEILTSETLYGNPSSTNHNYGTQARQVIENCRYSMLECMGLQDTHKLYFTSGATESINIALLGASDFYKSSLDQVVSCTTDHKAVLETVAAIKSVEKIISCPVIKTGEIDLEYLESTLASGISLVNCTLVNNEIGTIQPLDKILSLCERYGAIMHVDGAQMIGKIPLPTQALQRVDYISLSGHKFYGPKGSGALLVKKGRRLSPPYYGGGQEDGIRPGTYATHQVVGLHAALQEALDEFEPRLERVNALSQWARSRVLDNGMTLNSRGVPHNINFTLPAGTNMALLDYALRDYAYSKGSACQTLNAAPSHVLSALGHDVDYISRSIRVSLSHVVHQDQLESFFSTLLQSL